MRRLKAAKSGQHLPTEVELLRGMPFLSDDMAADVREFGERLSRRLKHKPKFEIAPLVASLDDLAVDQSIDALQCVMEALKAASGFDTVSAHDARLRIQFYLASCGHSQAAAEIAGETAAAAFNDVRDHSDFSLVPRALAWSLVANTYRHMRWDGLLQWPRSRVGSDLRSYAEEFGAAIKPTEDEAKSEDKSASRETAEDEETDAGEQAWQSNKPKTAVVFRAIGNDSTSEGKRVVKEFEKLLNVPLPLPSIPDLARVRTRLTDEFPYAVAVIDQLLKRLVGREHVHLRPTVLVGTPGCGKTRFARRLCEELAVPFELVSCGGLSDSALGGTARRWSSGEPSIAVLSIRRHQTAGPVVILDEIEKVGTSRHNGNPHDVLVGLLEEETSQRWFDPYVESACDLSHVSWLMTANTLAGVPSVLLDRCRVIAFPEPGPEELEALAPRLLERLYVDAGHDPRWATPLEQYELAALGEHWRGGSIRKLQQLLEALVDARERHRPRQ
ncbi:AAA family ATPase [Mesorhizobium sp. VK23B]|uniref:AAA family ATPase n=1 Tax=Mesorhizobium dulcispinae TaxID=3072316 RepID=A0ABU4XD52_9HYPH|nr:MULTISPECIES: AAA family ATPase [unclassified Mesorhizobium]MDX8465651.1 AAA family ATPase [Mesorhizobium sp. VK23B]MDX8471547.1 AAA family ATPase [Mesorhizobium sp. VK23A]